MNVHRWLNLFFYHLTAFLLVQVQADDLSTNHQKYCGKYLTEALSALCEGNYQTMRPVRIHKKSWPGQYNDSPLRSKRDLSTESTGKRRRKRGVYYECCEKSCSKDQLMQYCGAPR